MPKFDVAQNGFSMAINSLEVMNKMKKIEIALGDMVQPFQLESGSFVAARTPRPALDLILHQHAYPPVVGGLLAKAM